MRLHASLVVAVLALAGGLAAEPASSTFVSHRPIVVVAANHSSNWSGYNQGSLEQGGTQFHQVSGDWTVPTATAHKKGEAEYSSTWVGIGGGCVDAGCLVNDATLIQAGTEQDVDAKGHATYSAWWELIPAPGVTITSLPVKAGDRVHFDISEGVPGIWTFTAKNLTTGKSWTMTTPYSSTYATAEWIEETPVVIDNSGNVSVGPLPKLSTVHIDEARADRARAGLKISEQIQLIDSNAKPLATPSAPDVDLDGFNDCTYAATCARPTTS